MSDNRLIDGLNSGNTGEIYRHAYRYVSQIQGLPPTTQVQAICILFLHLCRVLKLKVVDVLAKGERIIRDAEKKDVIEMKALNDYLREEVRK